MHNTKISEVKGFAILCMLLGHVIQILSDNYLDNKLFVIIYSFHMPILMFISGYFFRFSVEKYSLQELVKNKCKHILIPIIFWSFPIFLFRFFSLFSSGHSFSESLCTVGMSFFGLWFLWSVFLNSIWVGIIKKVFANNLIIHIVSIMACFFIPICAPYLFMFICFEIGYGLARIQLKRIIDNNLIFICSLLFCIILLYFYKSSYLCDISGMSVLRGGIKQLAVDLYRLVSALLVSFFIISFFLRIKVIKILDLYGIHTMGIYILSMYLLSMGGEIFRTILMNIPNYFVIGIIFIVESGICLLGTVVLKKISFFNKLLG